MKVRMNDGDERDVDDARAVELVNSGSAKLVDPNAVAEVPSKLVSEADARQAYAETEYATPQEKRQAAVERRDLERGTHGRLEQGPVPVLAVADEQHAKRIELDGEELYKNKGAVDARPDSAGYRGVPDGQLGEPVSATSGPATDVTANMPDVPDVQGAQSKAQSKQAADEKSATPAKSTSAKVDGK